jgi:hypothetical protein
MDIKTSDQTEVKDNLKTSKRWVDGVHVFSTVKVKPPVLTDYLPTEIQPSSLSVVATEVVKTSDKVG